MRIKLKSYNTLSEAMADQANLRAKGVESNVENAHDIHPTLIGEVFLTVAKEDAAEAIKILNQSLF
jgi:RecB family endonuclease NucS